MAFDLVSLAQDLNSISAVAVIAGVFFVVFQLRQNAKPVEASNRQTGTSNRQVEASLQQNKLQVILSTADRFTGESYLLSRKEVRDIIGKYETAGWKGFEASDDYKVRGFISLYESTAHLANVNIVDAKMLEEGMGYGIVYDWTTLRPVMRAYEKSLGRNPHPNFTWLYEQVKNSLEAQGATFNEVQASGGTAS